MSARRHDPPPAAACLPSAALDEVLGVAALVAAEGAMREGVAPGRERQRRPEASAAPRGYPS